MEKKWGKRKQGNRKDEQAIRKKNNNNPKQAIEKKWREQQRPRF